jgi:hypothetical protein
MKVALHARVSTDDKGPTPENQFCKLWAYIGLARDELAESQDRLCP